MPPSYADVVAQLTAPGAPFEIEEIEVPGRRPQRNWKHRERSLREKVANAGLRGDALFLVQGERRISYGEFSRLVWGTAHALEQGHGFARGDRLAILSYNCPDWILALFGAVSLGGIGVGLNGWWTSDEIRHGLEDSGSRFLVVDERLYARLEPLVGQIESLERIFYIGDAPPPGTTPISELLRPSERMPEHPIDEDDPFVLLYTSGTTGRPKGCITTHRGTIAQVTGILFAGVAAALSGGGGTPLPAGGALAPTSLLSSPLFHVGGLHSSFCSGMTLGAKMVFTEGRFDPEQAMALIEREQVTIWGAIPTLLHRLVHHAKVRDYDLSSLRAISFGGAPTPAETLARAREVLPIEPSFTNAYGLTETHGVAIVAGGRELLERPGAVGRPMPLLDLEVRDAQGKSLPPGQLGELCFYGPLVTPGYWNRPEASAEAVVDGWLHTGDLGYRAEDGFFYVVDRAKDMILRGGENVYCVEIEDCLAAHPAIDEAAIVGVPDVELGERVKAVVVPVAGARIDAAEVQRHVARSLASFKVPEIVEFRSSPLPRNPAGKILKNVLRGDSAGPFAPEDLT